MALLMAPFLMDTPEAENLFPPDAIERAKTYLKHIKGGVGAYSDSKGNPYIRQEIANFITAQSGTDTIVLAKQCENLLMHPNF